MKEIVIEFEDEFWRIPLKFIAQNRADYYKSKREDDFNYEEEVEYVMNDKYEGIDWLENNMNYEDFATQIIRVKKVGVNTERNWTNAEKRIEVSK